MNGVKNKINGKIIPFQGNVNLSIDTVIDSMFKGRGYIYKCHIDEFNNLESIEIRDNEYGLRWCFINVKNIILKEIDCCYKIEFRGIIKDVYTL